MLVVTTQCPKIGYVFAFTFMYYHCMSNITLNVCSCGLNSVYSYNFIFSILVERSEPTNDKNQLVYSYQNCCS